MISQKSQRPLNKGEFMFCMYSEGRKMIHQQTCNAICNDMNYFPDLLKSERESKIVNRYVCYRNLQKK